MSENLDFQDIVQLWQEAAEGHIHPLWNVDQALYWESGLTQAQQAAEYTPKGGRVLDFGAGNGRVSIPLAKLGFDVIAVDSSPGMLAKLKEHAAKSKATVKTAASDGAGLGAAVRPGKVDTAVVRAVFIHHDPESIARLVKQIAGVIKKGGHLLADWPTGTEQVRDAFNGITVMSHRHRQVIAQAAGLAPVVDTENAATGQPSVWRKTR